MKFLSEIKETDILEWARQGRPDTKWVVDEVTNLTMYVNKLKDQPIGCHDIQLPSYVLNNKGLVSFRNRVHNRDNLCFFRAYEAHLSGTTSPKGRTEQGRRHFEEIVGGDPKTYKGVNLLDLPSIEEKIERNINVYRLVEEGKAELVQRSHRNYEKSLNLDLYDNHFTYIKDLNLYSHAYACRKCHKNWKTSWEMHRHESTCSESIKRVFPGGSFQSKQTVFELLEDENIKVPKELRYYPYRAAFDFEVYFDKVNLPESSVKNVWTARHVPLSWSVASNVPGHEEAVCEVTDDDTDALVKKMVTKLLEIQEKSQQLLEKKHRPYLTQLSKLIERQQDFEFGDAMDLDVDTESEESEPKKLPLEVIQERYEEWLQELPVIGYNSGRYDLNVIKAELVKQLIGQLKFVVKKDNALTCLSTDKLKFLDITNYLAPGYSYAQYLKAYEIPVQKGFFPYEWLDSLDKLEQNHLPTHEDFYSQLKGSNITAEEYKLCQKIWKESDMNSMKDFLIWYNNLDVVPFLKAIDKQFEFYLQLGMDMFKDGISVPGLTLKYLFTTLDKSTFFTLFNQKHSDLHDLIKENIVGGPSIVFSRYQEAGVTKIREHEYDKPKTCHAVVGYDANALYLHCLMQAMPTGHYVRRRAENDFRPEKGDWFGQSAYEWLEWEAHQQGLDIKHKFNGNEKRIGTRRLPVDGWCMQNNTIYQFHGCFWHGCECQVEKGVTKNAVNGKTRLELRDKTEKNTAYLKKLGYNVVEMWECQWAKLKEKSKELRAFIARYHRKPIDKKQIMSEDEVKNAIRDKKLFGLVECDVEVPKEKREYFAEMTPIFKNVEVAREDVGDYMKAYAEEHGLLTQPRKTLVGSYYGKKILLPTPLYNWYVAHGMQVKKVYQVVQYTPDDCFMKFGQQVSDARRKGDADPSQQILANTMKLLGNCGYGKTVTNKDRHRDVVFCTGDEAPVQVNDPRFRQLDQLAEEVYQVEKAKKKIVYDLPLHIGFFVYGYAKLRMLQFYYDFLDKYLDRRDFEYIEMDTDSAYIALSGPNIESLVRPELKQNFYREWDQWLPAEACDMHREEWIKSKLTSQMWSPAQCCVEKKKYDKRTPGLFKVEWKGQGMAALCSKTYFGWGEEGEKISSKGVNRRHTELTRARYLNVLSNREPATGKNIGFRLKGQKMYTYKQTKSALSFLYPKRKVLADGVSTLPLDV